MGDTCFWVCLWGNDRIFQHSCPRWLKLWSLMCLVFTCAHLYIKNRGSHRKLLPVFPGNLTTSPAPQSAQPRIPCAGTTIADEGVDKERECSHPVTRLVKAHRRQAVQTNRKTDSSRIQPLKVWVLQMKWGLIRIRGLVVLTLCSDVMLVPGQRGWNDPGKILTWGPGWSREL